MLIILHLWHHPPFWLQSLLIQAEPLALAAWLAGDGSAVLLQPLSHPLAMPLPSAALVQNDMMAHQQCAKAFAAVQVRHATLGSLLGFAQALSAAQRSAVSILACSALLSVHPPFSLTGRPAQK